MRITHRVRPPRDPKPVEVSEAYQREVDASTDRLVRRYREIEKRAEKARQQLDRAKQQKRQAAEVGRLEREVTARLAELAELERLMTASPAGAAHRGTEGWTKVPR